MKAIINPERLVSVPFNKTQCGVDFYINTGESKDICGVLTEHKAFKTDFFSFYFFRRANGYLLLNFRKVELRDGMVLLLSPHQQQEWHVNEVELDYTFLIFREDFMRTFIADKFFVYRLLYYYQTDTPPYLFAEPEELTEYMRLLKKIKQELQHPVVDTYNLIVSVLYYLLVIINRAYAQTYRLPVEVPKNNYAFKFKDLLEKHIRTTQRVQEYADMLRVSRITLNNSVMAQFGVSAIHLLKQRLLEELKNEPSHQLEAAQKKRDELIQQGENELEAARAKARALAQQVESQAYALTDELRQLQKDERMSTQQKAQRAREIAKKESEKLFIGTEVVHNPVKEFVPLKEVKVGQEVCIAELNQLATVLALPDKNGDVLVRAGIIKTKVPLKGLKQPEKLVKETKPQTKAQQRYSRLTGDANRPNGRVERVQRSAKMECNLLGLTVDEALPEVDSFIDRAILNGQTVVYLIHGNGTGALRTAIHKHLRGNRMVKSFRLGRYGEGESGVTVVELK